MWQTISIKLIQLRLNKTMAIKRKAWDTLSMTIIIQQCQKHPV